MCGMEALEELYITDNPKLVHLDGQSLSAKGDNVDSKTWPTIKKVTTIITARPFPIVLLFLHYVLAVFEE